jgi:hypothetical protein
MKKDIAKLWTAALRSGKYKQGRYALHSIQGDNEIFCCLGVLCDLYQQDRRKKKKKGLFVDKTTLPCIEYNGIGGVLPLVVIDWAGMNSYNGVVGDQSLTCLNDHRGYDFKRIAKFIEASVEVL